MSPTILRVDGFRFFFFSREEARPHVHVTHADGEAKVWLFPRVALARQTGCSPRQLATILDLTERHHARLLDAWHAHFRA